MVQRPFYALALGFHPYFHYSKLMAETVEKGLEHLELCLYREVLFFRQVHQKLKLLVNIGKVPQKSGIFYLHFPSFSSNLAITSKEAFKACFISFISFSCAFRRSSISLIRLHSSSSV